MLPWYQLLIHSASFLILNLLFITLTTAIVGPPQVPELTPHHTFSSDQILETIQQQSFLNGQKDGEGEWTNERKARDKRGKATADFISEPRLLRLKTEVLRVVGNCHVFH